MGVCSIKPFSPFLTTKVNFECNFSPYTPHNPIIYSNCSCSIRIVTTTSFCLYWIKISLLQTILKKFQREITSIFNSSLAHWIG